MLGKIREARKNHSRSLIWLWEIKHENHHGLHEMKLLHWHEMMNPGCAGDGSTHKLIFIKVRSNRTLDLLASQPSLSSFDVSTRRSLPGHICVCLWVKRNQRHTAIVYIV